MKKFFVAVCCAMIASSSVFAQDETPSPVADAAATVVDAVQVTETPAVEAAPAAVEAAPATQAVPATQEVPMAQAVPMTEGVIMNEGSVMEGSIMPAPVYGNTMSGVVNQSCCGGNVVAAPAMSTVIAAPMMAAPVATVAAPVATACVNCQPQRQQAVRSVTTRVVRGGRSVLTRVRGIGRRNNCCN
ncbi:MAG: hypothetical protein AB8B55_21185 [Mariniblastus sp.]